MAFKYIAGIVAAVLLIGYSGAIAWKLQDIPLVIVILLGIAMMAVDLWQSFKSDED
jgi:hypothetical protein